MIRYRIPLIFHFLGILFAAIVLSACQKSPGSTNASTISLQTIENKGSDTMVNLALAWAEAYQAKRPDISISVTGGGSGTGMAALINGTVDIANASRLIKPEERADAELNGIFPTEFIVARDAIAIIVNPENPVDRLTIDQIADIYSGKINNWSEVGGENLLIVRLSRETNSGTHIYFLEHVLRKGNKEDKTLFSTNTLLLPSSEGIGSEICQNPHAIGYDGLGYVTEDMKVIAVSTTTEGPYVLPSIHTVISQEYPISRDLYIYSSGEPIGNVRDYLDWILSSEAQEIVLGLGFVPITPQ